MHTEQLLAVDPAWRSAAAQRRQARTVPDAAACTSPGLETVLDNGSWTHPLASPGPAEVAGIMLVKPGMRAGAETLREIGRRLAECGYRAERARLITAAEIAREGLAVRHHGGHSALAARGRMSPLERIRYLRTYDIPAFAERFGSTAAEVEVFPMQQVLDELGVPEPTLTAWSMRDTARHNLNSGAVDGPNSLGDCLFVNVFRDPDYHGGLPFAVLNPHMPGVLAQFSAGSGAIAVQITPVSAAALPWGRMRKEFCGATDPREALPGSIRGDSLAGLLDISGEDGQPVRRINNGVHLSNGAVEALRDGWTWLRLDPADTVGGQRFQAAGIAPWDVITKPFLVLGRHRRVAQELTDHLDADQAVGVLSAGTLVEHADEVDDEDLVRLVDTTWAATADLRADPAIRAVLLGCPPDGPATTVVVHAEETAAELPATLARLGLRPEDVLPLWDPENLLPG